ncbi:MAG TPA: ABC transporter permease, partial [Candidatus Limnocylindria bacterium]|nr:ABC transporter permease [Candidatus Limnocylindria bacterium]
LVMLGLAPILGVKLTPTLVLSLIPVVIILSLGLSSLGVLIASFMQSQQGFQLFVQILIFPLIFLAGVFFPVNNVPAWMEIISKVNPLTYGVDAIRQIFLGSAHGLGVTVFGHVMTVASEMALVGVLGAFLLLGAVIVFNRQE